MGGKTAIQASNLGQTYSYRAWQSRRCAKGTATIVRMRVTSMASNSTDRKMSLAERAYSFETPEEFSDWLDDQANYVERKTKQSDGTYKTEMVRQTLSWSANAIDDECYWESVRKAAGDTGRVDSGMMTRMVRAAIWQCTLGRPLEAFLAWDAETQAEIRAAAADRMRGVAGANVGRTKALEQENQTLSQQVAELMARIQAMEGKGKS